MPAVREAASELIEAIESRQQHLQKNVTSLIRCRNARHAMTVEVRACCQADVHTNMCADAVADDDDPMLAVIVPVYCMITCLHDRHCQELLNVDGLLMTARRGAGFTGGATEDDDGGSVWTDGA